MVSHEFPPLPTDADPRVPFRIPASRPSHSTPDRSQPEPVGVLVIHGFTGAVYSVRDWALNFAPGHSVVAPALPGHESRWEDLKYCTWQDWYGHVEAHARELASEHRRVVIAGLSMGGALALRLAQNLPQTVDGLVLVNPALSLHIRSARAAFALRYVVKSTAGVGSDIAAEGADEHAYSRVPMAAVAQLNRLMSVTAKDLHRISAPILVLRSRQDHVISRYSHEKIMAHCQGPVETVMLPHSYHVATLDHDAPTILTRSQAFVDSIAVDRCPITGRSLSSRSRRDHTSSIEFQP